jgi:hypothetical protein
MKKLNDYVEVYKEQLAKGDIQKAYAGLVKYVTALGTDLSKRLSDEFTFGNMFQGYMDYSYFYYSNEFLKKRKLKFGLVLNHVEMQFEIWLLGQTIQIQEDYWEYFKDTKWNKGRTSKPQYSILETLLIKNPNFNNLDVLSAKIESKLLSISQDIIEDIKKSKLA